MYDTDEDSIHQISSSLKKFYEGLHEILLPRLLRSRKDRNFVTMGNGSKLAEDASILKNLSRNLSSRSPSQIADVYLAAINLLCLLKVDQATLSSSW